MGKVRLIISRNLIRHDLMDKLHCSLAIAYTEAHRKNIGLLEVLPLIHVLWHAVRIKEMLGSLGVKSLKVHSALTVVQNRIYSFFE